MCAHRDRACMRHELITDISGHCGSDCSHASQLTSSFFKEYIVVLVPQTWVSMNQLMSCTPLNHSLTHRSLNGFCNCGVCMCVCANQASEAADSGWMICSSGNRHSLLFDVVFCCVCRVACVQQVLVRTGLVLLVPTIMQVSYTITQSVNTILNINYQLVYQVLNIFQLALIVVPWIYLLWQNKQF